MSPPNRAPKTVPARRKDEVNPYLRTKVMTASPAELRLMLLDGAVRFAEEAHAGVTAKDYERSYEGFSRSQAIVMELIASLNHAVDPDLCAQLSGLYTYIYNRLLTGSMERDPAAVAEAISLLRYERETWQMLIESMAGENTAASMSTSVPSAPAPVPHASRPGNAAGSLVGARVQVSG